MPATTKPTSKGKTKSNILKKHFSFQILHI
jgi:hypothetical protein